MPDLPSRSAVHPSDSPASGARRRSPSVLYAIGHLGFGGTERQLTTLLNAISERDGEVHVAIWNFDDCQPALCQPGELRAHIHQLYPGSRLDMVRRLRDLVRRVDPDVLHSLAVYLNLPAYLASLRLPTVAIGSVRNDFDNDMAELGFVKGLLNTGLPRRQVFNSAAAKRNARRRLHMRYSKVTVIRNGVDLECFSPLPFPQEERVIVGIGSLVERKRWDLLIRAMAPLTTAGSVSRLVIAGEGPRRKSLEQLVSRLGLEGRVFLPGNVTDASGLLASAWVLAHPSVHEGAPNSVLEAMASARPVVASDAGDVRDIVQHGRTGMIVRRDDEESLREALRFVLSDRERARLMGEAGRDRAKTRFHPRRLADELFSLYRAVSHRSL